MSEEKQVQNTNPERKTAPGAIVSMVCGIIGLVLGCVPFVGIACGTIGIVYYNKTNKQIIEDPTLEGKGMAVAGMVCGIVGIATNVFMTLYFIAWGTCFSCLSGSMMNEMMKLQ